MTTLTTATYATTFHFRGTDTAPKESHADHFEAAEIQKKIDGQPVKVNGWKRKSVSAAIRYELPEGTPAHLQTAIEREIHLYLKAIIDRFEPAPEVLDVAAFTDFITPERGGASLGFDREEIKAAAAKVGAFVLELIGNPGRAEATAYVFQNFFKYTAICSPKGFGAKPAQVVQVLEQLGGLLGRFAESHHAQGLDAIVGAWCDALEEELKANATDAESLFAL